MADEVEELSAEEIAELRALAEGCDDLRTCNDEHERLGRLIATIAAKDREIERLRSGIETALNEIESDPGKLVSKMVALLAGGGV